MDGYTVVEVWVMVDENGEYVVHKGREELGNQYAEYVGELTGEATRVIRATINVPTPKHVELEATLPVELPVGELKVA